MNANDAFDYLANALNLLTVMHVLMASPPRDEPPWPIRPPTSSIYERQLHFGTNQLEDDWVVGLTQPDWHVSPFLK